LTGVSGLGCATSPSLSRANKIPTAHLPPCTLPFDDRCAEEAAQIRADLAAQGKPIGPHDILIAATARAHDAVLVTHNTSEFARVTGLRLEDWEV
jgi:tRNA(fMet)-specific endonuclease VapC